MESLLESRPVGLVESAAVNAETAAFVSAADHTTALSSALASAWLTSPEALGDSEVWDEWIVRLFKHLCTSRVATSHRTRRNRRVLTHTAKMVLFGLVALAPDLNNARTNAGGTGGISGGGGGGVGGGNPTMLTAAALVASVASSVAVYVRRNPDLVALERAICRQPDLGVRNDTEAVECTFTPNLCKKSLDLARVTGVSGHPANSLSCYLSSCAGTVQHWY
jgi:hypothetical protein